MSLPNGASLPKGVGNHEEKLALLMKEKAKNYALEQTIIQDEARFLVELAEMDIACDQKEEEITTYLGDSHMEILQDIDEARQATRDSRAWAKSQNQDLLLAVRNEREQIELSIALLEERLARLRGSPPCSVCKFSSDYEANVFGDRIVNDRFRLQAVADFRGSCEAGCRGCGMVLDAIETCRPGWLGTHAADGEIGLSAAENTLQGTIHPQSSDLSSFMIFQSQDDPLAPLSEAPFYSARGNIIQDTTSASALERVSAWLTNCLTKHECAATDPNYLPHRVLDVSPVWLYGDKVQLVEEASESAPYAALSYCWGSDLTGVVKTLKANKHSHCSEGIPLQSLPKTVRDAVLVCRGLRLRYLWVDALCIIQDDAEDWRREALSMALVYSNSQITIAAHAAASCKDGFLGEQEYGRPTWQQEFWTDFGPLPRNKMYVRTGWPESGPPSPLATRGWTLQEAILPRRMVHYTGKELAWECDSEHFCECGHIDGAYPVVRQQMVKSEFKRGKYGYWRMKMFRRRALAVDGWMDLVEIYSKRSLTFGSDKLIAIAGLADFVGATVERNIDSPNREEGSGLSGEQEQLQREIVAEIDHIRGTMDQVDHATTLIAMENNTRLIKLLDKATTIQEQTIAKVKDVTKMIQRLENGQLRKKYAEQANKAIRPGRDNIWADTSSNRSRNDRPSLNSIYVAGFFYCGLPRQLLWVAKITDGSKIGGLTVLPSTARPPYRAPTWSWASIDTPVYYPWRLRLPETALVKIHGSCAFSLPADQGCPHPNTAVSRELVLEGTIVPVALTTAERTNHKRLDARFDVTDLWRGRASIIRPLGGEVYEVACDESKVLDLRKGDPAYDCWVRDSADTEWCSTCEISAEQWSLDQFLCLQVARYSLTIIPANSLFFLVLQRSRIVQGAWERVGVGTIELREGEKDGTGSLFKNGIVRQLRLI